MISFKELLGLTNINDIPISHQHNLEALLKAINVIRNAYGKSMIVTSGYRSMQDHLRIYSQKGITDTAKIPMRSKHLIGAAVDISDPDKALYNWCKANDAVLRDAGLFLEERQGNWQHFQCLPFGSFRPGGSIWFNP